MNKNLRTLLPVVTLGIGSLKERVAHMQTGFIAKNEQEFANFTIKLLNDDDFYLSFKKKMDEKRKDNNWDFIASTWSEFFLSA